MTSSESLSASADEARQMKARLLDLLRREWVSPKEALLRVGCMSLSQRVGEFKRSGLPVEDRWVEQHGARFKAYRIATETA